MKIIIVTITALATLYSTAFAQLKNETGVGIVSTSGNTDTSSVSLKQTTEQKWGKDALKAQANFLTASNRGVESAYTWDLGLRYERELTDTLNAYAGEKVESNKYQNLNQRYSSDLGGKYFFEKSEGWNWFSELGYRFSRENYPYGFKNFNFLRLYNEIERMYGKSTSVKWWFEYLPNITEFQAYQFNTKVAVTAILSEMFSLETGYLIKYYNRPPTGTVFKTDRTFTTSIVAKF